jgi:hypothetical protein
LPVSGGSFRHGARCGPERSGVPAGWHRRRPRDGWRWGSVCSGVGGCVRDDRSCGGGEGKDDGRREDVVLGACAGLLLGQRVDSEGLAAYAREQDQREGHPQHTGGEKRCGGLPARSRRECGLCSAVVRAEGAVEDCSLEGQCEEQDRDDGCGSGVEQAVEGRPRRRGRGTRGWSWRSSSRGAWLQAFSCVGRFWS